MNLRRGFTLIELVIVIVVISIILVIAVPLFLRNRSLANETAAIAALRLVYTAEVGFLAASLKVDGQGEASYGTLEELGNPLDDGREPFIDEPLANGFRQGYSFTVEVFLASVATPAAFTGLAVPIVEGRTGVRKFYIDQRGVMRFTSDGSEPESDSTPLN